MGVWVTRKAVCWFKGPKSKVFFFQTFPLVKVVVYNFTTLLDVVRNFSFPFFPPLLLLFPFQALCMATHFDRNSNSQSRRHNAPQRNEQLLLMLLLLPLLLPASCQLLCHSVVNFKSVLPMHFIWSKGYFEQQLIVTTDCSALIEK